MASNDKNLFLIEKDGATVSWCPREEETKTAAKLWKSLVKQLKNGFNEINIRDDPLKYNPKKNTIKIDNNSNETKKELNKNSIQFYWNLIESNSTSARMYFYIGDTIPGDDHENKAQDDEEDDTKNIEEESSDVEDVGKGKRAIIVSSKLVDAPQQVISELKKQGGKMVNAQITMKLGDDEQDNDWDKFYEKITVFLNQLYQVKDDSLEYDDYDEFPYKIYQIEPSVWNNSKNKISQQAQSGDLSEFDEFLTKYGLDIELDGADSLEDYFDGNDTSSDCILFVTYKQYFIMLNSNNNDSILGRIYHWSPSYLTTKNTSVGDDGSTGSKEVDWNKEFLSMKEVVSRNFNLINNDEISFVRCDDEVDIENGEDIKEVWDELTQKNSTIATIKVEVTGQSPKQQEKQQPSRAVVKDPESRLVLAKQESHVPKPSYDVTTIETKGETEIDFEFDGPVLIPWADQSGDSEEKNSDVDCKVDEFEHKQGNVSISIGVDEKIVAYINKIDKVLINVNESSLSDEIEKDLEFICDHLHKRQNGVTSLTNIKIRERMSVGSDQLFDALKQRFTLLTDLMEHDDDYDDSDSIVKLVKQAYQSSVNDHDLSATSKALSKANETSSCI